MLSTKCSLIRIATYWASFRQAWIRILLSKILNIVKHFLKFLRATHTHHSTLTVSINCCCSLSSTLLSLRLFIFVQFFNHPVLNSVSCLALHYLTISAFTNIQWSQVSTHFRTFFKLIFLTEDLTELRFYNRLIWRPVYSRILILVFHGLSSF